MPGMVGDDDFHDDPRDDSDCRFQDAVLAVLGSLPDKFVPV